MKKSYIVFGVIVSLIVFLAVICNMGVSYKIETINNSPYKMDRYNAERVLPKEKKFKVYTYRVVIADRINFKKFLNEYPEDAVIELGDRPDNLVTHVYTDDPARVEKLLKEN